MCLFCYNQILDEAAKASLAAKCPNCRSEYDEEKIKMQHIDAEQCVAGAGPESVTGCIAMVPRLGCHELLLLMQTGVLRSPLLLPCLPAVRCAVPSTSCCARVACCCRRRLEEEKRKLKEKDRPAKSASSRGINRANLHVRPGQRAVVHATVRLCGVAA